MVNPADEFNINYFEGVRGKAVMRGLKRQTVSITGATQAAPKEILFIDTLETITSVTLYCSAGCKVIPYVSTDFEYAQSRYLEDGNTTNPNFSNNYWVELFEDPHTLAVDSKGRFTFERESNPLMRIDAYPDDSTLPSVDIQFSLVTQSIQR